MGALLAGTRYRGDFEERIKAVLKEIEKIDNSIYLSMKFILLLVLVLLQGEQWMLQPSKTLFTKRKNEMLAQQHIKNFVNSLIRIELYQEDSKIDV